MADLENLLLEAAGRTRHSHPPSRGHDHCRSDSGGDDSDDEHNYSGRKPPGSQVPLKKRFDSERDDGEGSQEGGDDDIGDSSDESDIGDDLYKNEDDRRKLSEMTELQREMILSNRATRKNDKDLLGKLASKREKGNTTLVGKLTTPHQSSRVRSSARSTAKDGALNELRAKRLKQQDSETNRRISEASRSSGARHVSPKRKPFPSTIPGSSSDSESRSDSDDDGSSGDDRIIDSDDDRIMLGSEGLSFEDIKEITIRRSKLAKWFMEPFFEELIVGCFVRVGIGRSKSGPIYRLCMVKNVDASDRDRQYKLENKTTHKYLNLVWGNETSAARWQMAMISDSPPLEEEFKQWLKEVERRGGRMPTKEEVVDKKEAIQKIKLFVYSAATVKQMLQEKKSTKSRPLNIAAEKDRLRTELDIALSKHKEAEANRITKRLQELEESRKTREKDARALKLAEMNRKNRFENFKNASELKPNIGLKAGEVGHDPFSRRWTRSRNYYAAESAEEAAAEKNSADEAVADTGMGAAETAEVGMVATAVALEAAAGAGKLVDTSAPVDQGTESNMLHNFELPISLAILQNFGGAQGVRAGFMAQKQRIETTIGFQVLENDGARHALTLTVSDYKRRRGLL
ncbi:protein RTF1 homolog [Cajanus cajan]|uniref:RNA polymerase-associated protein RTF1 isogeny n=1 Tax=Cajanus cajan TaxID=3821 RepID=A0A151TUS1_CAJCA|nr:protein RTF1 homolog [Cajanus cajan]XP_020212949.1 protein RTF1 homolog [Cajanus cajan]KYP70758.1 RNA polymerase-associated protein RTF1 isogeny [Cajanus cajan]